ncbi:hypothetical protein WN48_09125, partial [Eufriesea mexicana]
VYLTLTILCVSSNANFYEDHYKSVSSDDDPWIHANRDISYDFASSEPSPSYSRFLESRKNHRSLDSTESFDKPKEWYSSSSTKKVPTEDKNFKKIISPFYTITDKDSQKYKDMVMKSGVPYCQEIKTKRGDKETNAKDSMICFKCKNPKNGASYEQCSYASQPLADSSNIEEVVVTPSGFRNRRSSSDEAYSNFKKSDNYRRRDNPYRFNDKIFSEATDDVPAEYKNKNEKCEKMVKDSMVCMICKDTKSNAKYEQCSYVQQPNDKKYAYTKSSSHSTPERKSERDEEEDHERGSNRRYSGSKPVKEYSSSGEKEDLERESREETRDSSGNCKKVQKGSQTCTICKDPKTGGNYEKCSYTYEPDDKVYKYSTSKSFGYPRSSSTDVDRSEPSYEEAKPPAKFTTDSEEYKKDYSIPESSYEKPPSSEPSSSYYKDEEPESSYHQAATRESKSGSDDDDHLSGYEKSKSESERVAESIQPSYCKEVQKGSMSCKVCKDPKTGSNSEQCSYKYEPSDKSYSYSKSKSFGTPTESRDKSYDVSEKKESQEPSYESRSHDYPSEKAAYVTDSDIKRDYSIADESKSELKEESPKPDSKKIDAEFYDSFKKKTEIQKVLQDFQKEDRSKCKKLMRDKMTCYQCTDEKGFEKEECAFVTADEPAEDKIDYRESKEYHVEPTKKVPRSIVMDRLDDFPVEPEVAASERVYVKREQPNSEDTKDAEASKEAEPYEYVEETKPVFDKVLGFTLPAYMLSTSEHEEEFDKIASSRRI